jgi:hypothetical protein
MRLFLILAVQIGISPNSQALGILAIHPSTLVSKPTGVLAQPEPEKPLLETEMGDACLKA